MVVTPTSGGLDAADQEARYAEQMAAIEARRQEFAGAKSGVLAALAPYRAFDLMAALQIASSREWPRGQGPPHLESAVTGELLALLLVERGSERATENGGDESGFVQALERFGQFAAAIAAVTPDYLVRPPSPLNESVDGAFARIQKRLTAFHFLGSIAENDDQADQATTELFDTPVIRDHLEAALGFDAKVALTLTDAVARLISRGYMAAIERSRETGGWLGHGESMSFTIADLATEADVELAKAERFLERVSLEFDGSPLEFGVFTTPARRSPFLRQDTCLMPISVPTLRRSIRGSLAALLNPKLPEAGPGDKGAFTAFTAGRGEWLEHKASDKLSDGLRPNWAELNVYFELPDGRKGEIDALHRIDDTLIVVQAKSGVTRIDTETGDPDRFRDTLVNLLGGENFRQHRDALAALTSGTALTRDAAGEKPLRRNLETVSRVLPIHVTLEDLSAIGAQPWLLIDAGLAEDGDLPWMVGVDLMEMLLEYFELPALFLHFLTRRLRANRSRQLLALDEVDWAVRYGEDELLWAELSPEDPYAQRQFAVLEEHHDFSRWQLARQAGEKIKRPRPNLSGGTRKLLEKLDRSRPQGWLAVSLALLDLNREQRPSVIRLWERQVNSDRSKPGPPLNIGFGPNGQVVTGFSIFREEREVHPDVESILVEFCEEKIARYGAREWFAIVAPFEPRGPVRWCCRCGASSR
jgi:hypothetical protein